MNRFVNCIWKKDIQVYLVQLPLEFKKNGIYIVAAASAADTAIAASDAYRKRGAEICSLNQIENRVISKVST